MVGPMAARMSKLFDRYTDEQLALILDFSRRATEATRQETYDLRDE